ncbi:MAG TPA: hypothetical protein VFA04_04985 [Bryobacteraceae bacterium]|nr:hypothetical protein [Bryobacteraceae bacterium]
MIPAVFRGVVFCLLFAFAVSGETLDEAVHTLARRVAARLAANEAPHVILHDISSLSGGDAARARTTFERALRSGSKRAAQTVDITLTLSRNIRGYLLVAELERNGERVEDMQPWQPDAPAPQAMHTSLAARIGWEQDTPMLDLAIAADRMLILEPSAIVVYVRGAAGWERPDSRALDGAPVIRDPRGRLQISGDSFTAFLPGATCHGSWSPSLDAHCEPGSAAFSVGGAEARFTPGRNTLEVHPRAVPFDPPDSWGDDFIKIGSGCARGEVLATAPGDRASPDSVTAYDTSDPRQPSAASEPADLPGPVLALWPAEDGALAIIRDPASRRYAAYNISVDCSH